MPSKRSLGRRRAAEQPEFLIDRSLGRLTVPEALRSVGLRVLAPAEVYGEEAAQETEHVDWIRLAAQRGWVVLCKDDRIRRRPAERDALMEGKCARSASLTQIWASTTRRLLHEQPPPHPPGGTQAGTIPLRRLQGRHQKALASRRLRPPTMGDRAGADRATCPRHSWAEAGRRAATGS